MTKVHLNILGIILGTKCNLQCAHCMGGSPKEMTIQEKYIDDLIPNLTGVDELYFAGFEPTLYIKEMKKIFDKLLNAGIRINRFSICTNAVIYSKQLVDFVKHYKQYVSSPERIMLHFSSDRFHFNNGFTKEKLLSNIEKYRKALDDCRFVIENDTLELLIQGRANRLNNQDINGISKIEIPITDNINLPVVFKPICEGSECTCSTENCVSNCIVSQIIMTPDGHIFLQDTMAYNALDNGDYTQSIGHIKDMPLYDMIQNQMDKFDEDKEHIYFVTFRDKFNKIWQIRKMIYDYIVAVNQILECLSKDDKSLYKELRTELDDKVDKIPDILSVCRDSSLEIETANTVYNYLLTDYQTLIDVADSCFSFTFMKFLFKIQAEMYKKNSPFNHDNFYNLVGIDYDLFMDYWKYYYECNFEEFKKTVLRISRQNKDLKAKGEFNE